MQRFGLVEQRHAALLFSKTLWRLSHVLCPLSYETLNISHIEVECFRMPDFVDLCVKMSIRAATEVTEYLDGHVGARYFEISFKSAQKIHRSI